MGYIRKSEDRYAQLKAQQQRDVELAYSRLELEAERSKRGAEALERLGNLVAALLYPDFELSETEPAIRITGRANETRESANNGTFNGTHNRE